MAIRSTGDIIAENYIISSSVTYMTQSFASGSTTFGNSADDLQDISVVPNPYIVNADHFNESSGNHLLRFTRLPTECDISIYTVSGEFVTTISHNDSFDSNEWWDMKNGHNQEVAPGLYIYVVETPGGDKIIDKFAVVR